MIRLTIPSIDEDDLNAVREVLASGYLVQGEKVAQFEETVAEYVGTRYAIAVCNCTAALHISLLALGVGPGDIVVVTAYSWISTANVIELCGAEPAFVDIRPDTFNMDPECLERTLNRLMGSKNTAGRVKAILPVHIFGQMADMPEILDIANRYELPAIEDAACALGATLHGRQAGTWGRLGCFSFHPRKAITTGEGGMIITDDSGLARKLRALRNHGQDPEAPYTEFIMPGFNYRLTEFQAALGITQMRKIDKIINVRRNLADNYDKLLRNTSVKIPKIMQDSRHIYQSYVILLPIEFSSRKEDLINALKKKGIETTIGTYNMPLTKFFRERYDYTHDDFPVAEDVFRRSLTLPVHDYLSANKHKRVINLLNETISEISHE